MGRCFSVAVAGVSAAVLTMVLASAAVADDADDSVEETPHFVNVTKYAAMSDVEREAYLMGAFDGFLYGVEVGTKGWPLDWVDRCQRSLTSGKLMAKADSGVEDGMFIVDGKPINDRLSGASNMYSALYGFCHPQ
jgi:hypothetical protein